MAKKTKKKKAAVKAKSAKNKKTYGKKVVKKNGAFGAGC